MIDVWVVDYVSRTYWKSRESVSRAEGAALAKQWRDKRSALLLLPAGRSLSLGGEFRLDPKPA